MGSCEHGNEPSGFIGIKDSLYLLTSWVNSLYKKLVHNVKLHRIQICTFCLKHFWIWCMFKKYIEKISYLSRLH